MLVVGHAGELHPRVTAAFGLPSRTVAVELDMSAIEAAAARLPGPGPGDLRLSAGDSGRGADRGRHGPGR